MTGYLDSILPINNGLIKQNHGPGMFLLITRERFILTLHTVKMEDVSIYVGM